MKRHTKAEVEALTNWDGLLCKPPWRNQAQKRQYYSRFIQRMLWRYFTTEDWKNVASLGDSLRVPVKLKRATHFLAERHMKKTSL